MNIRAQLILMAATLAPLPLYAQEAPAAVPATPVAAAAPTAELAAVSPLALIPADADAAFILTHAGKRISEIHGENPRAKAIGSIAVGASKGNARLVADLASLDSQAKAYDLKLLLGFALADVIDMEVFGPAFEKDAMGDRRDFSDKLKTTLAGMKLHPVYCVVSIPEGQEAFVESELKELEGEIKKAAESDPNREFVTVGGLFGAKFTIPQQKKEQNKIIMSGDKMLENAVADELGKRSVYMLIGMKGGHAVGVICEDPAEIAFAAAPEQSLLATEAWQAIRPNLKDDLIFAASLSPDLVNESQKGRMQPFVDALAGIPHLFEAMADASPERAAKLKAAAAGVQTIAKHASTSIGAKPVEKTAFLQVWGTADAFHAEVSFDAQSGTFTPTKSVLAQKAADADTVFCIESSPYVAGSCGTPACALTLVPSALDVVDGVIATLKPEYRAQAESYKQAAAIFLPDAAAIAASFGTMSGGFGGTTGLVIDSKVAAPRIALYSGVANRAMLARGWDALLQAVGGTLEKCGQDSTMLQMLPIVPKQLGDGATSYTVAVPGLTMDLGANATVSDTAFAIGTSANLNNELVTTATAGAEFAGISFTLNTAALADAASKVVRFMDTMGAAKADVKEAEQAAENLRSFSEFVQRIKGGATIKGGLETIRIDAELK